MTERTLTPGTVVRETTVQGTETEYTVKFVRELDGTVSIQVQDKATGKEVGTESLETAVFLKITDEKRQVDEEVQREQQQLREDTARREKEDERERNRKELERERQRKRERDESCSRQPTRERERDCSRGMEM